MSWRGEPEVPQTTILSAGYARVARSTCVRFRGLGRTNFNHQASYMPSNGFRSNQHWRFRSNQHISTMAEGGSVD